MAQNAINHWKSFVLGLERSLTRAVHCISLCNLRVLCVSVVSVGLVHSPQRHREHRVATKKDAKLERCSPTAIVSFLHRVATALSHLCYFWPPRLTPSCHHYPSEPDRPLVP